METIKSLLETKTTAHPYTPSNVPQTARIGEPRAVSQGMTLDVDGTTVHCRETGSGTPVLLLHGGGSSGAQWRRVGEILSHRYRVITMDHFGHGGTGPWPDTLASRTHDADAKLVRAVMTHVGESVHLVGHSYGGGIALRLALMDDTGIRSLTLIEPAAMSLLWHGGERTVYDQITEMSNEFIAGARAGRIEEVWQAFIDGNNGPGKWQSIDEKSRNKLFALTDAVASCFHANLNHTTTPDECRSIILPTLAVYGGATPHRFRRMTEMIAEEVPGCQLEVLPGASHMSPLTHPEELAAAFNDHFHGVDACN